MSRLDRLPFIRLDRVYHLGSLDVKRKGDNFASSYEGNCLSVSLCPNAWEEIARLGGSDLHALERADSWFLDVMRIDAKSKRAILEWAESAGYAEIVPQWRLSQWDPELEERVWTDFDTREEAEQELEEAEDGVIRKRRNHVLTEKGASTSGGRLGEEATDMACLLYVRDMVSPSMPEVVGLWWKERYNPECHSAPRGGILPEALNAFRSTRLPSVHEIDDAQEIRSMPAPTLLDVPRELPRNAIGMTP